MAGLGYVFHAVAARRLSVPGYGELQFFQAVFGLLCSLGLFIGYIVVKYCSKLLGAGEDSAIRPFLRFLTARVSMVTLFLGGLTLLLSPGIWFSMGGAGVLGIAVAVSAAGVNLLNVIHIGELSARKRFDWVGTAQISGASVRVLVGIFLATLMPQAAILALSLLLGELAVFWVSSRATSRFDQPKESQDPTSGASRTLLLKTEVYRQAIPIALFTVLISTLNFIDVLWVKLLTTPEFTGYYSALSLLAKLVLWANSSIITVVFPDACENGGSGKRIPQEISLRAYGLCLFTALSACALYAFLPTRILALFFGSKYLSLSADLWRFGVIALLLSLVSLESNLAFAREDYRVTFVLGGIVLLSGATVFQFHGSIPEIATSVSVSLVIGLCSSIALHFLPQAGGAQPHGKPS